MLGKYYQQFIVNLGDSRAKLEGALGENGFTIIHDYFQGNDYLKLQEVSNSLIGSEESQDILLKFPFLAKPLFDENIISIIRDYLGPHAVLDYVSGRRFLASGNKSDDWHHDSVGHRIKIFMCINDQNETTHTKIVPNTHRIKYSNYQQRKLTFSEIENSGNVMTVIGKKNDLIIFDTNIMHRGVYSDAPREIVQFEFTDIRKSFLKGHIGIRKSKFDLSIAKCPLISQKHLKFAEGYAYFK